MMGCTNEVFCKGFEPSLFPQDSHLFGHINIL